MIDDDLLMDIITRRVSLDDLPEDVLQVVLTRLESINQTLIEPESVEAAEEIAKLFSGIEEELDPFDAAILASQERGNTYFEFEEYVLQ